MSGHLFNGTRDGPALGSFWRDASTARLLLHQNILHSFMIEGASSQWGKCLKNSSLTIYCQTAWSFSAFLSFLFFGHYEDFYSQRCLEKTNFILFEHQRKSLIQHCERRELRLHFEWTKVNQKCQNSQLLASFWKLEACGQTVLPDMSVLIGQKMVENAKVEKFKWYNLGDF